METTQDIQVSRLAEAWAELQAHAASGQPLEPDAYRLAFADPEFLLRRETRGIRIQLELLKPDLDQSAAGIENTIVVLGSARFPAPDDAEAALAAALATGDASAIAAARRGQRNARHYALAREFARLTAENSRHLPPAERLTICTGGGPGIMEAATRGARDAGAPSVALNIALPHEQSANPYVTPDLSFKFHYFAMRKMHLAMRANALVVFPGGFGTLDELFEILTLQQTNKAPRIPTVLVDEAYWRSVIDFRALVAAGMVGEADLALFRFARDADEAWAQLQVSRAINGGGTPVP